MCVTTCIPLFISFHYSCLVDNDVILHLELFNSIGESGVISSLTIGVWSGLGFTYERNK